MVMWESASGLERMLCGVLVRKLQESMHRYTGYRDITEILLKTVINTVQSISRSSVILYKFLENMTEIALENR